MNTDKHYEGNLRVPAWGIIVTEWETLDNAPQELVQFYIENQLRLKAKELRNSL